MTQSPLQVPASHYKGPQDLNSLLNSDEWSPTSLFPLGGRLDRNDFPPDKPQPYLDLINRLSKKGHPDLKFLSSELRRQKGDKHAERSRAAVLEYSTTGGPPNVVVFPTSMALDEYVNDTSLHSLNRLYILEDIATNYVEVFGDRFSIEPSFWAHHLRTTDRETSKIAGNTSILPSIRGSSGSFSLIYPECTIIDDSEVENTDEPRIRTAKALFADCNLYRRVSLHRPGEFYDGVAVINRRASFWSKESRSGDWNALILVDPPLMQRDKDGHKVSHPVIYSHDFLRGQMVKISLANHAPYQGGYIDFVRAANSREPTYTGPTRNSFFDDLIYYHKLPTLTSDSMSFLDTAILCVKNIVAGTWMNSIAYVGTSVLSLEYAVEQSRKHMPSSQPTGDETTTYGGLEWLEKNLFHIYSWKRRCSQMHDWTDWNLQELENWRTQLHISGNTQPSASENSQLDWSFIKKRLEFCEACSRDIVASALGLLSLIESHKSVEEAESARVLALLGTVYLPLSLTAGLLSMSGTFTPGQSQFWIFFAVAVPLMAVSLGATYTSATLHNLIPWVSRNVGKKAATGLKKQPTFVKDSQKIGTV